MSGSTRSRHKRKLEPISLEELAGTTGMSGFCSFLTRDNSVPVPVLDHLDEPESSAPDSHAPQTDAVGLNGPVDPASALDSTAPVLTAPNSTAPEPNPTVPEAVSPTPTEPVRISSAPVLSAPPTPALDYSAPESAASDLSALDSIPFRRRRIREASTVQDAHSLAEQAVYDAMYRAGKPYQGDSRVLTIGLRTLAEISRMAYSNCKANVRSLVVKLAIEERPGFSYTEGRTYVVYSFREILRRRRAAGLTHVVRTRGVAFVDPLTGQEIALAYQGESGAPDLSALLSGAPTGSASLSTPSASPSIKTGAHSSGESSALAAAAHIKNRHLLRNTTQEPSSSAPDEIVSALRNYIADVDDEAAAQLWHRCRANSIDAQPEEVIHFIRIKAARTGIRTPLGFLLTAVPKCFVGDSFRLFREERVRSAHSAASRDRQFAEEILKSPEADDEQKQWAREVLGLADQ